MENKDFKVVSFKVSIELAEGLKELRRERFINTSELARTLLTDYLINQGIRCY